jgi:hypothetical protein
VAETLELDPVGAVPAAAGAAAGVAAVAVAGGAASLAAGAALAGSVTICRVVAGGLASSAASVSPLPAAPGFNSMLRGRVSSAAMAAKLKATTVRLANAIVHRDMGSLLWLGTISNIRNQRSEVRNQATSDLRLSKSAQNIAG